MGETAVPEVLVSAVAMLAPPANAPLAPEEGAVNVTLAFATGLLLASFTTTVSALPKAVLTIADWPLPLVAVIVVALPLTAAVTAKVCETGVAAA